MSKQRIYPVTSGKVRFLGQNKWFNLLCWWKPGFPRGGCNGVYWFTQIIAGLLFKILSIISYLTCGLLFFRLKVKNKRVLEICWGPMIVTPLHKSYFDHFFILAFLLFSKLLPARAIAADWVFKTPIIGWAAKNLFGAYRLPQRKGLGLSLREMLREPLEFLQNGGVVGIYPEGGIRFKPGVHEVKVGAAFLAKESGAPILPVAIKGIDYLSWKAFFFGRRKVVVIFGNPFLVDRTKSLSEISEDIRQKIADLYNENA